MTTTRRPVFSCWICLLALSAAAVLAIGQ